MRIVKITKSYGNYMAIRLFRLRFAPADKDKYKKYLMLKFCY
jgi:hypothetical protein